MAKKNPYDHYAPSKPAQDLNDLFEESEENLISQADALEATPDDQQAPPDDLVAESDERARLEEERLRIYAEMDNFKKRLQREQAEQMRYAAEKVLADLLPALDNLELALQYGSDSETCKPILMGVSMTHKSLLDALRKHGLEAVGQTGETFDPLIHEAVGQEEAPELDPGLVSRLLQRGYKLGDRLLRPARVMVSR